MIGVTYHLNPYRHLRDGLVYANLEIDVAAPWTGVLVKL
jgi:hypothetical protein